jgi:rubrerythrin
MSSLPFLALNRTYEHPGPPREVTIVSLVIRRCNICGNTIVTTSDQPIRCPHCGAASDNNVAIDRAYVPTALPNTRNNTVIATRVQDFIKREAESELLYRILSEMADTSPPLGALFKTLEENEKEHKEVFTKFLIGDVLDESLWTNLNCWWASKPKGEVIRQAIVNERNTANSYAEYARITTNTRLRDILTAFSLVELEHEMILERILTLCHKK